MPLGFLVLLKLTVTVAQPAYDFAPAIFEDGTVAFTAVLANVSRSSVHVCTDSLESIRVKSLTVDGEPVAPRAPDRDLDITPSATRATLYPGATVDLRVAALLADGKKGARLAFVPPQRGEYKLRLEYRCAASGKGGVAVSNVVTFRVH